MKNFYPLIKSIFSFLLIVSAIAGKSQSFTAGNVVIYRVGATGSNLVNTGNPVFLDEYTPAGTLVQSIALPTAVSGSNKQLIASGTAGSEGALARSADKRFLVLSGYAAPIPTAGVASTPSSTTNRTVGLVDFNGAINTSTALNNFSSGNNIRGAYSTNGTDIWIVGGTGGINYTTTGSTTSTQISTTVANLRTVNSFNGQLYISSGSGTTPHIGAVGTGLPTTAGQTISNIPGYPTSGSQYAFFFADLDATVAGVDVLYVASDDAAALSKYSLVAGSWVSNGVVGVAGDRYTGLTGIVTGSSVTLFATRKGGTVATGGGELVSLVDATGYNATFAGTPTLLATAATQTAFRGVALAPEAPPLPTVSLSVTSNTGSEAGTTAITVTATASAAVTSDQTVTLAVLGTGITAGDYTLSNTTITIANGSTTGTVTFTVVDDTVIEGTETATLTISSPSSGITLGTPATQNITITDNDVAANTVNLSVSSNTASEQAGTLVTVTATASTAVSGNQTVALAVTGTGITATDYTLSGNSITIPSGQTTGTVTLLIRNDAEAEGTETAVLTISAPSSGIVLGTTTSQSVAITDNVCQPFIRKSTATSANGAEISAFDPTTNRVFTVAGAFMEYYTLSNTGILSAPSNLPVGFTAAGNNIVPNSVGVRNGIVAVAYAIVNPSTNAQLPGVVAFYNASTATYISQVTVGYLPDMLIFSPDGNKILTANEGEPNSYGQGNSFDPEGSVSIIDISAGVAAATVVTPGFTSFNGQIAALRAAGVRIFGPGATVAQDFEPEYISISGDGLKAFVTLQENNAVAELDLTTSTFTQIIPLGLKDHSLPGNGFDASDRDSTTSLGKINIQNWPVFGMYQPDGTSSFTVGGNTYYITANEGDSRSYTGFDEEIRVGAAGYVLDPAVFPNAATLKQNASLGRLQLTNASGNLDGDSEFEQINAFGARSFSIWNSSFSQIFDSGDQLEQITATLNPGRFNADNTDNSTGTFDTRSDNKGPEPEAATTGTINGVLYAFIGIERSGDIFVYDISNPAAPVFKQYIDNVLDFGVEGLIFVPANQSPTGKPLLISSAEVSKTVTVYEFSLISNNLVPVNTTVAAVQDTISSYGDCTGLIARVGKAGANAIAGSVTARAFIESTVPNNSGNPFVQRHYEIVPAANAATSTGRVTLYFTQTEFDNFNADPNSTLDLPTNAADVVNKANLLVVKYPGESTNGSGLPQFYTGTPSVIDPADADIIFNTIAARWEVSFDVTGFSGFFIQTNASVLPVNLISFTGKADGQNSVLNWKVNNEINLAEYTVEYSTNAQQFLPAGKRQAVGNTADQTYNLVHENAAKIATKLFYRLKMTDNNGTVKYSDIVIVRFDNAQKLITDVYPSPTTGIVNIVAGANNAQPITLSLYDVSGRLMKRTTYTNTANYVLNVSGFANGLYLLEATTTNGLRQQFKIVKN